MNDWLQAPVELTRRQYQIIQLMKAGLPNKEIAARLDITEGTVKTHAHALFQKLDASNRTQAVLNYIQIEQRNRRQQLNETMSDTYIRHP